MYLEVVSIQIFTEMDSDFRCFILISSLFNDSVTRTNQAKAPKILEEQFGETTKAPTGTSSKTNKPITTSPSQSKRKSRPRLKRAKVHLYLKTTKD